MKDYALRYLRTQERLTKNRVEKICFFAFTLSKDRKHRLEFTKIYASNPEEAYTKGEEIGEWIDFWENEVFPTLHIK